MNHQLRKRLSDVGNGFAGIVIILFLLFPIFWIGLTAFKPERYVFSTEFRFAPTLDSFRAIFQDPLDFWPLTVNSLVVSTSTVLIALPLAVMAAYAFSRYTFRGQRPLLIWVLITQFLPPVVVVLPFFALFRQLQLVDTKIGLIWINLSIVLPYSIWMIKGFVDALPTEIEQASLIDGCNEFQTLRYITLPLLAPSIITAGVFLVHFDLERVLVCPDSNAAGGADADDWLVEYQYRHWHPLGLDVGDGFDCDDSRLHFIPDDSQAFCAGHDDGCGKIIWKRNGLTR